MRRKHAGYIFQFTLSDHEGRHIHVFKDDQELGVFDRVDGPIRGLEKAWNKNLQAGLESLSVNCMNVDTSIDELRADRVWYDVSTKKLFVQAKDFVNGITFDTIAEDDFESKSPVVSFSLGHKGATVVCHHKDGKETWLPTDMWLPDGFTPGK